MSQEAEDAEIAKVVVFGMALASSTEATSRDLARMETTMQEDEHHRTGGSKKLCNKQRRPRRSKR